MKLNFSSHIETVLTKAKNALNLLKAISSKEWGKHKETIVATYKTILRPHLEYASTIWAPILSETNLKKLQTLQNAALRVHSHRLH